ncbi:unnamed protein product [Urochloa decumbens]|uniref:Uncharacterized protein n=1 Tax=Urochloa decumbens TaxID=240449 RepID=A0ABC9DEN9_9POAL
MALGTEMARPFPAAGGGDDASARAAVPAFLATETTDRPVDPAIWSDEKQMKRELVAWAKAVAASMAAAKNASSSMAPPHRRRVCP